MTDHAAVVQGEPVPKDRVDAFLETVPGGPDRGAGLHPSAAPPRDATNHDGASDNSTHDVALSAPARAERQRRRWATQVVVADELARRAVAERGLPPVAEVSPTRLLAVAEKDVADLGSIVAAALAHSPAARTLLTELEAEQHIPEEAVRDYYDRNRDCFLTPDALRRGVDPFGGRAAPTDFLPFEQVQQAVAGELRRAAGRRAFFAWFDRARADVVYAAGHEHPGDPAHPDHEHRH
ncbi:peptidyl-prolyl cis-trans isomerase [Streptomyces longisporus]|uniref:Malonyl CoA-ACP transacylase n=1 Tax=Streptomyces longisporus TaxID=1948 RepID=A0ABN3M5P1_STRLO